MYIKGTGEVTKLAFIGERFHPRQRQTNASQVEGRIVLPCNMWLQHKGTAQGKRQKCFFQIKHFSSQKSPW